MCMVRSLMWGMAHIVLLCMYQGHGEDSVGILDLDQAYLF